MNHPFNEKAIPLAFGDTYRGFKIVGTNSDYLDKYKAKISKGKLFNKNFEVVVGSEVAQKLKLKVGGTFFGSHGDAAEGEVHDHYAYKISGIASSTGSVIDNLILCNIPSVWQMHDTHEEEAENPAHGEEGHIHEEGEHVHTEACNHDHEHHQEDMTLTNPIWKLQPFY